MLIFEQVKILRKSYFSAIKYLIPMCRVKPILMNVAHNAKNIGNVCVFTTKM